MIKERLQDKGTKCALCLLIHLLINLFKSFIKFLEVESYFNCKIYFYIKIFLMPIKFVRKLKFLCVFVVKIVIFFLFCFVLLSKMYKWFTNL